MMRKPLPTTTPCLPFSILPILPILPILLILLILAATSAVAAEPGPGQRQGPPSPAGFTAPPDVKALLDYRLPTWGYRTLQMDVSLLADQSDGQGTRNSNVSLATALAAYHESEDLTWYLQPRLQGGYRNFSNRTEGLSRRQLAGSGAISGSADVYVAGDWSLTADLEANVHYLERRSQEDSTTVWSYGRDTGFSPEVGLAYGRVRDVTPLLRARRLGERLVALGRPDLSEADLQALAGILARRAGYTAVFDRNEKVFWDDVLGGLAADDPLTPYEVLYLTEVMVERLGTRRQGWQVGASIGTERDGGDMSDTRDFLHAGLVWSHNPTLDHQLSVELDGRRAWWGSRDTDEIELTLQHLWVLADRFVWTNRAFGRFEESTFSYDQVTATGDPAPDGITRRRTLQIASRLEVYLEDRLVLTPSVAAGLNDVRSTGPFQVDTDTGGIFGWNASLRLTWYLDRWLS